MYESNDVFLQKIIDISFKKDDAGFSSLIYEGINKFKEYF